MRTRSWIRISLLVLALGLAAILVPLARLEAATNVPCDTTALISAIQDAVDAGGTQTLKLAKDCTYLLTEPMPVGDDPANATGLPTINKVDLTIKGNGATIKRKANARPFRLLDIRKKGELTLQNLTLRGGRTAPSGDSRPTGAGGAISLMQGKLVLNKVTVTDNETGKGRDTAVTGGVPGEGGGIYNWKGELEISNSSITNNRVGDAGNSTAQAGGLGQSGGGIFSYDGMLTIDSSTIDGNHAGKGGSGPAGAGGGGYGGGIYATHLRLTNSTVSNNRAGNGGNSTTGCAAPGGSGGGIYTIIAMIANTTISSNQAGDGGTDNKTNGAICGFGNYPYASGGGLFATLVLVNNAAAGDIYITNSTITGNRAGHKTISPKAQDVDGRGGNLYVYGGLGYGYETYLRNTIIGTSSFGNPCAIADPPANLPNVIVNVANNLDSGTSCGFGSANGSKSNASVNLGPLQDNGGDTFTHALLSGSQALDAGNDSVCAAAVGSPNYGAGGKDQREITRPQFAHCDIGAYEHQAPPTPTATPTLTPTQTPSPTPTQPSSGTCAGPSNGRVGCWKGENNANDSAKSNDGTVQGGATYVAGKEGQAFSFNGTTGHILVPDSANLDVTNQFTLSAWVNPKSLMDAPPFPGKGAIISKIGGGGGDNGYQYGLANNNKGLWCQFNAAGEFWPANQVKADVTGLVPLNKWTHVACTYDHARLTAYVNGKAVGTLQVGPKTVANTFSNLRISSDDNGNVYFDGLIDEAQVWKRALSAQEIKDVYNGVGGGGCTDKPEKPTLKVPADDTIINTTQPKLKWNEVECAATYDVTIQDNLGQTVAKETGLTKLQYTPLLTPGYTYKWFVHAVNEHGKTKSAAWTFFIQ